MCVDVVINVYVCIGADAYVGPLDNGYAHLPDYVHYGVDKSDGFF